MKIDVMAIADYDEVMALWKGTAGMGMRSLDDSREGIARFLKRNPTTNFIARSDGAIVGVILCGHDGRRGYIYHTAVSAGHRGLGIGRSLVEAVVNALQKERINKVALVVFSTNDAGNRFWQALGFETRNDLIYRNLTINAENI